ncbi:Helix-turn-helix type 11 domain protein [Frankia sp. Hr75.2]|nr:Helix-turn-helix type 11 domain protein [Frankia sp. Hr75.2]
MLETSARLLRLLSLLQTHRDWSGADLADRLGVTARTVRRDVDKLRSLGYPVHAAPGTAGGYRLGAGAQLPPLLLDDDEAVAVAVSLRTAAGGSVEGIAESAIRALTKLEQVLPTRLRHRVLALHSVTVSLRGTNPAAVDPDVLMAVATACRENQQLRFDYRDHNGTPTARIAEPHTLVHTGWRWYLIAWDVGRGAWRNFRLDRIAPKTPTGPRFTPRDPPADDIQAYTSWSVSTAGYRYQARVRYHAPAGVIAASLSPTSAVIEALDDESCLVRTGSNSLDALAIYLSLVDADFDVLEPPELVDRVRELAGRLARAAPPPPPTD